MPETQDPQPATPRDIARIWEVIESQRTAFLVTRGAIGPHARPMNAIVRTAERLVWFLTDVDGMKDSEIDADGRVALIFTDGVSTHVALTGDAEVVHDRAAVRALWSTAAKAFYPEGPEDPAIVALRVSPLVGELWDGPSRPVALVQMAAALVTGNSAADMGNNVKADMDRS